MTLKIVRIFLIGVGIYIALIALLYFGQRSMLYFPDPNLPPPSQTRVPEMSIDHVQTADHHKNIIWSHIPKSAPFTVVFFHGNAQNIATRDIKARPLLDAGYGVVLVEYRGFGGNPGTPTQTGLMDDARSAVKYLTAVKKILPQNMVFYGESLGSGVAVQMASEFQSIAGLILEVPFDSTLAVAQGNFPFVWGLGYLMQDQYRNDLIIGGLHMPKLVLIAGHDRVVPAKFGRRLFDLAADPKQKVEFPDSGHNELYNFGADTTILDFLKSIPTLPKKSDRRAEEAPPPPPSPTVQGKTDPLEIRSGAEKRAVLAVEVAIKPDDLERGLQHRHDPLPDGHGMLFIFPKKDIVHFWMKDTFIPLDMIFIDGGGQITKIYKDALPHDEAIVSSEVPVQAVLELNAGASDDYGLSVGDQIVSSAFNDMTKTRTTLNE